jgi:hypothetical protein
LTSHIEPAPLAAVRGFDGETYCWRSSLIRLAAVTTVSANVVANTSCPPVHQRDSRKSAASDGVARWDVSNMIR